MKTIKERMDEYIDSICSNCRECRHQCAVTALRKSFIAGAESEHAELTRWHDPKEELPANDREVLCKIDGLAINCIVLKYNNFGWWMPAPKYSGWCACAFNVLAWREIYE